MPVYANKAFVMAANNSMGFKPTQYHTWNSILRMSQKHDIRPGVFLRIPCVDSEHNMQYVVDAVLISIGDGRVYVARQDLSVFSCALSDFLNLDINTFNQIGSMKFSDLPLPDCFQAESLTVDTQLNAALEYDFTFNFDAEALAIPYATPTLDISEQEYEMFSWLRNKLDIPSRYLFPGLYVYVDNVCTTFNRIQDTRSCNGEIVSTAFFKAHAVAGYLSVQDDSPIKLSAHAEAPPIRTNHASAQALKSIESVFHETDKMEICKLLADSVDLDQLRTITINAIVSSTLHK